MPKKMDLSVKTTWARNVVPVNARSGMNKVLSHLQRACVKLDGLRGHRITLVQLGLVSVKQNYPIDDIAHLLWV